MSGIDRARPLGPVVPRLPACLLEHLAELDHRRGVVPRQVVPEVLALELVGVRCRRPRAGARGSRRATARTGSSVTTLLPSWLAAGAHSGGLVQLVHPASALPGMPADVGVALVCWRARAAPPCRPTRRVPGSSRPLGAERARSGCQSVKTGVPWREGHRDLRRPPRERRPAGRQHAEGLPELPTPRCRSRSGGSSGSSLIGRPRFCLCSQRRRTSSRWPTGAQRLGGRAGGPEPATQQVVQVDRPDSPARAPGGPLARPPRRAPREPGDDRRAPCRRAAGWIAPSRRWFDLRPRWASAYSLRYEKNGLVS